MIVLEDVGDIIAGDAFACAEFFDEMGVVLSAGRDLEEKRQAEGHKVAAGHGGDWRVKLRLRDERDGKEIKSCCSYPSALSVSEVPESASCHPELVEGFHAETQSPTLRTEVPYAKASMLTGLLHDEE